MYMYFLTLAHIWINLPKQIRVYINRLLLPFSHPPAFGPQFTGCPLGWVYPIPSSLLSFNLLSLGACLRSMNIVLEVSFPCIVDSPHLDQIAKNANTYTHPRKPARLPLWVSGLVVKVGGPFFLERIGLLHCIIHRFGVQAGQRIISSVLWHGSLASSGTCTIWMFLRIVFVVCLCFAFLGLFVLLCS